MPQTKNFSTHLFIGLITLFLLSVTWATAQQPNQAGLVVRHGNGEVVTECVEFAEEEISGYELLERSGLDLNIDASNSLGVTVCRLDGKGCNYPQNDCFCRCQSSNDCTYWSYWHFDDGDWDYSPFGASSHQLRDGDIDGWVWSQGQIGSSAESEPPQISLAEICAPPPTKTPTPQPTATATATETPQPTATKPPTPQPTATPQPSPTLTATPQPTETPTPDDDDDDGDSVSFEAVEPPAETKPVINHFTAEQTSLEHGQSTSLSWELEAAQTVRLQYAEHEEEVATSGSKSISPSETTEYTLIVSNGLEEVRQAVTIAVITPSPTTTPSATPLPPSATPTPIPNTGQPVAAQLSAPTNTPRPPTVTSTATPTPEPTAESPAPTSTTIATPTPTATATPASVAQAPPPLLQPRPLPRPTPETAPPVRNILLVGGLASLLLMALLAVPVLALLGGALIWWWRQKSA